MRVLLAACLVLVAVAGHWYRTAAPHVRHASSNPHSHPYKVLHSLWTPAEVEQLMAVVRSSRFQSTTQAYTPARFEHIGEIEPVQKDGSCRSSFMTPNKEQTHCVFPERIDVAAHHILSGGIDARKERVKDSIARLIVMQRYFHASEERIELPQVARLFESPEYLRHARPMCQGRSLLDPMTLALIVALPGQMVAMHYDLPWFMGADRYDLPGWLLVVMQRSGLFQDRRVPQVQGVAYLHRWTDSERRRGGFFLYANGTQNPAVVVPAKHNTAIICDGTTMPHGTQTYLPDAPLPPITKDGAVFSVQYVDGSAEQGEPLWELFRNNASVRVYRESDLRITLVWRQHCLRDASERQELQVQGRKEAGYAGRLTAQEVLDRLKGDLRRRGITPKSTPRDLMLQLVDEYVAYPFPQDTALPYNIFALETVGKTVLHRTWQELRTALNF